MATILELAELSSAVYGDTPVPNNHWKVLRISPSNPDGYYGVAYINTTTHEIVIANRGTIWTSLANLINDAELAAHEVTPDELSAIAFAKTIAGLVKPGAQYAGYSLIETGHSLGGSEAQAATAYLVDHNLVNASALSAVTFQSPGITSQLFKKLPGSYNVLNLYNQGDVIHAVGGTHLGVIDSLAAGPTLAQEAGTALIAAGRLFENPVAALAAGAATFAGMALGDAHRIETTVAYLQSVAGTGYGALTPSQYETLLSTTQPVSSGGATVQASAAGQLAVSYNGATLLLAAPDSQTVTFGIQSNGGGIPGFSDAFVQELTTLGPIGLPTQELSQAVPSTINGFTSSAVPYGSGTTDFLSLFNAPTGTGATTLSAQTNAGSTYYYNVSGNGQGAVETIQDPTTNGSVWVGSGASLTQLTGGKAVAGSPFTWKDGQGTQYVFAPNAQGSLIGTLTISGPLLGVTGDQIAIDNFSLAAAEITAQGEIGIRLGEQVALATDPSRAADPFLSGNYAPPNVAAAVGPGGVAQTVTVNVSAASDVAQEVTLTFAGANTSDFALDNGGTLQSLASGTATVIVPAGADSATVTLVATHTLTAAQDVTVTAALAGGSSVAPANQLTVSFPASATNTQSSTPPTLATVGPYTVTGGVTYYQGNGGNDLIQGTGSLNSIDASNSVNDSLMGGSSFDTIIGGRGNDTIIGGGNDSINASQSLNDSITGGAGRDTIIGGTGQDTIIGSGGPGIFQAGNGDNQVYADTKVSLATALAAGANGTASGLQGSFLAAGNGNNTLVGGTGNDQFVVGDGNNVLVLGPGNDTVLSGVTLTGTPASGWQDSLLSPVQITDQGYIDYQVTQETRLSGFGVQSTGNATGTNARNSNVDSFGVPVGVGNDTIFAGAG